MTKQILKKGKCKHVWMEKGKREGGKISSLPSASFFEKFETILGFVNL